MDETNAGRIMYDNTEIRYRVIFSRRRSVSIIVSPDKIVTVRAPYGTSKKSIEKFIQQKSEWISKHLERQDKRIRINNGKKYYDGEPHLYMGKEKVLRVRKSKDTYVNHHADFIEAGVADPENVTLVKRALMIWYRKMANEKISYRMKDLLERLISYGFSPSSLTVRPLKSRWGSCSSKGRITINSELIKLDPVYTDYVLIHELCHLKHHNHGKDYYRLLGELIPDYKAIRKELKKYITG